MAARLEWLTYIKQHIAARYRAKYVWRGADDTYVNLKLFFSLMPDLQPTRLYMGYLRNPPCCEVRFGSSVARLWSVCDYAMTGHERLRSAPRPSAAHQGSLRPASVRPLHDRHGLRRLLRRRRVRGHSQDPPATDMVSDAHMLRAKTKLICIQQVRGRHGRHVAQPLRDRFRRRKCIHVICMPVLRAAITCAMASRREAGACRSAREASTSMRKPSPYTT